MEKEIEHLKMITSDSVIYMNEEGITGSDEDAYIFAEENRIQEHIASRLKITASAYTTNAFNLLKSLSYDQIGIKQYISENYNESNSESNSYCGNNSKVFNDDEAFNPLTDLKQQSNYINKIIIKERKVETISDPETLNGLQNLTFYPNRIFANPLTIYKVEENNYWTQDIYGVVHHYFEINCNYQINDGEEIDLGEDGKYSEMSYSELSDISSITLGNGLYCELTYPVVRINYTNEQPWREKNRDPILCGYRVVSVESGVESEIEPGVESESERMYIGFNCYNFISKADYSDLTKINQHNKMRENGKYLADRHFIVDHIRQMTNEQTEGWKGI